MRGRLSWAACLRRLAIFATVARLHPGPCYIAVGRARGKHGGDTGIAALVLSTADILALGLGLLLALHLTTAAILIVFASDGGQHIQHHAVDRREHALGEVFDLAGRGRILMIILWAVVAIAIVLVFGLLSCLFGGSGIVGFPHPR
jgi:hypothetical protein